MNKKFTFIQLLTAALMLLSINFAFAQQSGENLTFSPTFEVATEGSPLLNLISELHPTIYINEDNIFVYGGGSFLAVECLPSQINQLYTVDNRYETVELIKIKLRNASDAFNLNLSNLQHFSNLKYVQIIFEYAVCGAQTNNECLLNAASSYFQAGETPVLVMFHLAIPQ